MLRQSQFSLQKRLNIIFNVAIVVSVLVLSGVLVKKYLLSTADDSTSVKTNVARGERISLPEANWQTNTKTLLLFLHSDCSYCKNSSGFYENLIEETSNRDDIKLLAVFSDNDKNSETFLKDSNISRLESRQTNFAPLGIKGTPTLVLVDENGIVLDVWIGKLSPKTEVSLLTALGVQNIEKYKDWFINEDDVNRLASRESTVIVDLRERENYNQEHFPDAINIPADELPVRAINELSPTNTIIIYGDYEGDKKSELAEVTLANQGFENVLILQRNRK